METSTLRTRVQEFRDKAREILKMERIETLLQQLFHDEKTLKGHKDSLGTRLKKVEVLQYEKDKLDEKHPEYKDKLEKKEKEIQDVENTIKQYESYVKAAIEQVEKTNKQIDEVEEKFLVSIEAVDRYVKEMIANLK